MNRIVVPPGLLNSDRQGHGTSDGEANPTEQIDSRVKNFSRPRSASMCVGGLQRTRATGQDFPNVNPIPIDSHSESSNIFHDDDMVDPFEKKTASPTVRPRSKSLQSPRDLGKRSSTESPSASSSSASWRLSGEHETSSRATRDKDPIWLSWNLPRYNYQSKLDTETTHTRDFAPTLPNIQAPLPVYIQGTASRHINRRSILSTRLSVAFTDHIRRSSLHDMYEVAKRRQKELRRSPWVQICFEYFIYLMILTVIYFVLVGVPLWKGAVYWLYWVVDHKFAIAGTWSITIGLAVLYAFGPLFIFFENDPPPYDHTCLPRNTSVALIIPCYKSAAIIGSTLESALKVFPAKNIFVVANGNSPVPLEETATICASYGVNHTWSPIGSKIIAQFIGCHVSRAFQHVLLIDDDCILPSNFPLRTERLKHKIKCLGYTIKSVGANRSRGTLTQRAQDLEYKISGLQRAFAGKLGSATFPHGAISLWDREFLLKTFYEHPGFSVSEDWFFGHVARALGSRIIMDTEVFVETETPSAIFWTGNGGSRGGFGEMTVWKQRFHRWNFFFVNGLYWNTRYIFCDWKLGWWEIGAKLFVFQEIYETLLYLLAPFVLPISLIVQPAFCGYLLAGTLVLYLSNTVLFNEIHLRRKNQHVDTLAVIYYFPYKIILTFINVLSCYWSIFKYARYFAKRHPKVVEDEKVVEVALRIQEEASGKENGKERLHTPGRIFSVVVETRFSV